MSEEGSNPDLADRPQAEVDRIRDIIFGSQMRGYEQQFKRVAGQLEQLNRQLEELRAALDRQKQEQGTRTETLQQDVLGRHDALERTLTQQIKQAEDKASKQGADLTAHLRDLAADLRKQGQELRGEYTSALEELEDDKAGRGHLGDLLLEMGMRLKQQSGLADLLGPLQAGANPSPTATEPK